MTILGINTDAKTSKGTKQGYLTGICYLAPSNESGCIDTCPFASEGCRKACLFSAGRGAFDNVRQARINKTLALVQDEQAFLRQLIDEIAKLERKAKKEGKLPAVRLNGTSDLNWESKRVDGKNVMEHFPNVNFYDYTKNPHRMKRYTRGEMPSNYHLTFSRSESNQADVDEILGLGGNVAAVFRGTLPATYQGKPVVNGDESDLRFLDPAGCVVGLVEKGKAKKDCSGFVIEPA